MLGIISIFLIVQFILVSKAHDLTIAGEIDYLTRNFEENLKEDPFLAGNFSILLQTYTASQKF